jgi:hypothetical protein
MRISQRFKALAGTAGLALLSGPAFADVTAQDVWANWQSYMQEFGYELSSSENASGGQLVISDLVMTMDVPEEDGSTSATIGEMTFVENGDGSVAITLSNDVAMNFAFDDGIEDVVAKMIMHHEALTSTASGTADAITYDYSAGSITLQLAKLEVDGEEITDLDAEVTFSGIAGTSQISVGDTVVSKDAMTADNLKVVILGKDPETGDDIDIALTMDGLQGSSDGNMPLGSLTGAPTAMFGEGLDLLGKFSMKGVAMTAAFESEEGPSQVNVSTGPGAVDLEMSEALIAYSGQVADMALSVSAPDVPLPIDVSFGELGYGFNMPLQASEEEQDFALSLDFVDIGLSDFIWDMFDPGTVLPRDAASLIVDLTGKATVFEDIVTLDEDLEEVPGEINSVTLNALELSAAGAEVTGTGNFTFDNTDLVSFDGFPRPEGAIDLNINGINGLMDKLISMGLLPQEQAMPARMMLGMFSVAVGEDQLTSRIEVNEQGHVLANGQRLK